MSYKSRIKTVATQEQSLLEIAQLIRKGIENPRVRATAVKLIRNCTSRDDACEIQAIFDAVKTGNADVAALAQGFKYIADPKTLDFFQSAERSLAMCERGICGSDCDDHTILVASLLGSIGFTVGARAYGPSGASGFTHVYAMVVAPKKASYRDAQAEKIALDTTVPRSHPGWEPPPGRVKTAWIER